MFRLWFMWILSIWPGPLQALLFSSICWYWPWLEMLLTRILLLSVPISMPYLAAVFSSLSGEVGVLPRCLPTDRSRQQTASCKAIVLRWTLTTVGCRFRLHLLLRNLQRSRSAMDAIVQVFCIVFSRIILNTTGDNGHHCRTFYCRSKEYVNSAVRRVDTDSLMRYCTVTPRLL